MNKNKNSGFSLLIIVAAIAILIIAWALGFVVYKNLTSKKTSSDSSPAASTASTSTKTHKDTQGKYSFEYPSDWIIVPACTDLSICQGMLGIKSPDYVAGNNSATVTKGAIIAFTPYIGFDQGTPLADTRARFETSGPGYTTYAFTNTTLGGLEAYQYSTHFDSETAHANSNSIVFVDKAKNVGSMGAMESSVAPTTSKYYGNKALELVRSTWKWL